MSVSEQQIMDFKCTLCKPAKGMGGDKYEVEFGNIYIPQDEVRASGTPAAQCTLQISTNKVDGWRKLKLEKKARNDGCDKYCSDGGEVEWKALYVPQDYRNGNQLIWVNIVLDADRPKAVASLPKAVASLPKAVARLPKAVAKRPTKFVKPSGTEE